MNTAEALEFIGDLMEGCGQALYNDSEWNAPVWIEGKIVGANGISSFEAASALDAVAGALGIKSVTDYYSEMCEADDAD